MSGYWAQITIGGRVSKTKFSKLEKAFKADFQDDELELNVFGEHLVKEDGDAYNGEFKAVEKFCYENGLPFERIRSLDDGCEKLVYTGHFGMTHSYLLDRDYKILVNAEPLMDLSTAINEITFETAPTHLNSAINADREYAAFLLSGGDCLTFIKEQLKKALPPPPPPLPQFEILESLKLKGK